MQRAAMLEGPTEVVAEHVQPGGMLRRALADEPAEHGRRRQGLRVRGRDRDDQRDERQASDDHGAASCVGSAARAMRGAARGNAPAASSSAQTPHGCANVRAHQGYGVFTPFSSRYPRYLSLSAHVWQTKVMAP